MELNKKPSITPNGVVMGFLKFKMANSNNDKCLDARFFLVYCAAGGELLPAQKSLA